MAEAKTSGTNTELVETIAKTVMETQKAINGTVVKGSITRYKAEDYKAMSKKNGTVMGRKKGQKTKLRPEELRILLNERWSVEDIMDKHGITPAEFANIKKLLAKSEGA